jgi:hypothetical protein
MIKQIKNVLQTNRNKLEKRVQKNFPKAFDLYQLTTKGIVQ